jgi:hypothetical protein
MNKLFHINISFFLEAEKREIADKVVEALCWFTGQKEEGEEWKGKDFEVPMQVLMHVKEVPNVPPEALASLRSDL